MSTAANTTLQASRAGSKKKAPKQTAQVESAKPVPEAKEEHEVIDLDDDISHHLYETIKCVNCLQPPVSPKQCVSCQSLTCATCLGGSMKCISCSSTNFVPVKDKILLAILDKFVLFNHQCSPNGPIKTFNQTEMDLHKNSPSECASKKYRCFCQGEDSGFTMSYSEILKHLKSDCGKVRIQCHLCQQDQPADEASFSRDEFKAHKCYTDLRALQGKLREDKEFLIAQVVQIQSQKYHYQS